MFAKLQKSLIFTTFASYADAAEVHEVHVHVVVHVGVGVLLSVVVVPAANATFFKNETFLLIFKHYDKSCFSIDYTWITKLLSF